jgi:RNA polymerase sigma-70 factor (ECF subfamily)
MLTLLLSMIDEDIDRTNFESFYHRYANDVFRRIYGILQNQQDTEDIVQETWMRVVENIALFRGRDEKMVRSYILRVAVNASISHLRERNKEEALMSELDAMDMADERDLFAACEGQSVSVIVECIRSLGEIYSGVLVYFYLYQVQQSKI